MERARISGQNRKIHGRPARRAGLRVHGRGQGPSQAARGKHAVQEAASIVCLGIHRLSSPWCMRLAVCALVYAPWCTLMVSMITMRRAVVSLVVVYSAYSQGLEFI